MSADAAHPGRREVRIGERLIPIESPNGFKFMEATELIGQISEAVPTLQAESERFVREYRERNGEVLDRAIALIKYPEALKDVDDEWWESQGQKVTLLGDKPDGFQHGLAMFKKVYSAAREPLVRLVAVLAAPAGDLHREDTGGDLNAYLEKFGKELLHNGRLTDLVVILVRSLEAMKDEFAQDGEAMRAVGEIQTFLGRGTATPTPSASSPSTSSEPSDEPSAITTPPADTAPTADESSPRPASSTPSPSPTDGAAPTPSTDPAGRSSESSEPASATVT